jgi:hypothetical protein
VWAIGDQPSGGAPRAIPPGRYTVTLVDDTIGAGTWIRCKSVLCGLEYPDNQISIANGFGPGYSSVVELEPSDVAVWIQNVILTRVS